MKWWGVLLTFGAGLGWYDLSGLFAGLSVGSIVCIVCQMLENTVEQKAKVN